MSFVSKLVSKNGGTIHVVKSHAPSGAKASYYLIVYPGKLEELKLRVKTEKVKLSDYGQVVTSCYGHEHTEEVKAHLAKNFGVNF